VEIFSLDERDKKETIMSLNLVEICLVKYPGQIEAGNISFKKPDENIYFAHWAVPEISQPTEESILAEEPQWVIPYAMFQAFNVFLPYIDRLLDTTAQSKQYGNAVSCASYVSSTNPQWKLEAETFVSWRDAVFVYAINIQTEVQGGAPIPSFEEFVAGLPAIVWPN
jgi:hypothetical protein